MYAHFRSRILLQPEGIVPAMEPQQLDTYFLFSYHSKTSDALMIKRMTAHLMWWTTMDLTWMAEMTSVG